MEINDIGDAIDALTCIERDLNGFSSTLCDFNETNKNDDKQIGFFIHVIDDMEEKVTRVISALKNL